MNNMWGSILKHLHIITLTAINADVMDEANPLLEKIPLWTLATSGMSWKSKN